MSSLTANKLTFGHQLLANVRLPLNNSVKKKKKIINGMR